MELTEEEAILGEQEVRAIVRLLGNIAIGEGDATVKRRRLMEGLSAIVEADGWVWSMTCVDVARNTPICVNLLHGGLTDEQVAGWVESSQEQEVPLPENRPMTELVVKGEHFTRTRDQVVADEAWYSHPAVRAYRLGLGIDHFLYSIYPLEADVISAIGLYRHVGRPAFSAVQRRLTHIVLSEVKWLHSAGLPGVPGRSVPNLSPRLRTVLVLMLDGHDRKRIAGLLGISPYTAAEYMRGVYRHFGVSSQLELIRRFTVGDERDRPGR